MPSEKDFKCMPSEKAVLVQRTGCPVCEAPLSATTEIYHLSYASSAMRTYLSAFYGPQGTPEPERVADEMFTLRRCKRCSLIFQMAVPSETFSNDLYETWIDPDRAFALDRRARNADYYATMARELATFLVHLKERRPLKVFDFGMGWGEWCLMARAFGCDVFGAELSQARRDHARQHGIEVIDIGDLPTRYFDLIHTEQVFEHLVNPLPILKQLCDALSPGGLLKISVPDGSGIEQRLTTADWLAPKETPASLNPVAPLEHVNCFNHSSLVQLGRQAALEPVRFSLKEQYAGMIRITGSGREMVKGFLAPVVRRVRGYRGTNIVFTIASSHLGTAGAP